MHRDGNDQRVRKLAFREWEVREEGIGEDA